jgi:hypothetical protein
MRQLQALFFLAILCMAQTVLANKPLKDTQSPLTDLQNQIDALNDRIQTLESNTPDSSVEGRYYCFALNLLVLGGNAANETESVRTILVRRSATFSGGTMTATLLSNVFNDQQDNGVVANNTGQSMDTLVATYTQMGKKLDITFADASTATWYTSEDGSVITGSSIDHGVFGPGGIITVGFVRNWMLIEADEPSACDAESQ